MKVFDKYLWAQDEARFTHGDSDLCLKEWEWPHDIHGKEFNESGTIGCYIVLERWCKNLDVSSYENSEN